MDTTTNTARPFGFWITAVDRLLRAELALLFEDEGVTRRDWRALNLIDGTFPSERPLRAPKLRRLLAHGWVERTTDGWALTTAGELAKQRLDEAVTELRDRVAGAVTPEEYETMTASLEKIARELGWTEGKRLPRRSSRRHHHRHSAHSGVDPHGHGFMRRGLGHHGGDAHHHEARSGRGHGGRRHGWRGDTAPHIHIHTHH